MAKMWSCIAGLALFCSLTGCGNGSANNNEGPAPPTPPPAPSFSLSLSPSSVTLLQGGSSQTVQVSVTPQNGFTGTATVSISASALPSGVTVSPASLSVAPGLPQTIAVSASGTAQIAQQTVPLTASSGTLTANASLQMTVTGAAIPDPFHPIGGSLTHGFYDESRQLLFAANLGLNELDVISGQDFSIKARVPVPQPLSVDQMADGKTLVIGTEAQEIVTVDEDTLAVTLHPYSDPNALFTLFFPTVTAMANGKVFVIGQEQGIDSSDIVDGGQYLYEWDSNTNTFTRIQPTNSLGLWETDYLARSADHKWAVFAADQFYLYSSDSDSFTTAPLNTVDPPNNIYGVRGYAMNADGSKIAVASAQQVTFLNRSLQAIASTPIPGSFQLSRTAVQFSADSKKLYLQYDFPIAIEEIDANSYQTLGYVSGTVLPDDDNVERMLATDASGRAFAGIDGGLRIVNLMQPMEPNPSDGSALPGPSCPSIDAILPLNSPQQIQLGESMRNGSIYVGGQPAALVDGGEKLQIPASSIPGPVDVECMDNYGNIAVLENGASYGVDAIAFSASLLPPIGNPPAYLFGYGFNSVAGDLSSLTFNGQSIQKPVALQDVGPGTIQGEGFFVPNGSPNESASMTVSSPQGTGTLSAAATYYAAPTILSATGLMQLTFDSHRNVLYALKSNEIDVLDAATLQWQSPIKFPAAATGTYSAMALAPDGAKLVVGGVSGNSPQFIVLDPDDVSAPEVLTDASYRGFLNVQFGSLAITNSNTVLWYGSSGVALDLTTSAFSTPGRLGQVIRSSADGSHTYSADLNVSDGAVYSVDPSTYATRSESFGYLFWTDLAVSPDGSEFAAIYAPPNGAGDIVGFFNSNLQFINANVYPSFSPPDDSGVLGATFSPGGKVLVVPLGDSIELWDAAAGTLRSRVMVPERLHVMAYPENAVVPVVALDSTGQTIYAISASGLTVLTLPEPMDQMAATAWPMSRPVGNLTAGFHGTIMGRIGAMNKHTKRSP